MTRILGKCPRVWDRLGDECIKDHVLAGLIIFRHDANDTGNVISSPKIEWRWNHEVKAILDGECVQHGVTLGKLNSV